MNTAIISIVAPRNLKQFLLLLLVLVVGVSALIFSGHFFASLGWVQHGLSLLFKNVYIDIFHKHLLIPVFWFVLGLALIIQTFSPASRGDRADRAYSLAKVVRGGRSQWGRAAQRRHAGIGRHRGHQPRSGRSDLQAGLVWYCR